VRRFFGRALQKFDKLRPEQARGLLAAAADQIDRLETALDSINEGILVCDSRHRLLLANDAARRLLPLAPSRQDDAGPVWEALSDESLRAFLAETLANGDKAEGREFTLDAAGPRRLLSLSVLPLVRERRVSGAVILASDITEKRAREALLRRMESLASLSTLAAGVAHEIKNPLGSLSIHTQLAEKALDKAAAATAPLSSDTITLIKKHLGVLTEEIERLNRIVVHFLFAVRPLDIAIAPCDLNVLVSGLADFVRPELEAQGIHITLDLAPGLPKADADERYLKQALLNLVKNAQAAMPSGGTLRMATALAEGRLRIEVSDSGVGIPPDVLSRIFEPYFTTKEMGSGLGLTLVFKIIREHKGEVTVESAPGKGSAFVITLPLPQKARRLLEG
jgi:signal transduction histidine kinase